MEDVKPIVEKCKNKAFTPPVTIKNFFKPMNKLHGADVSVKKGTNTQGKKCMAEELPNGEENTNRKIKGNSRVANNDDTQGEKGGEVVCIEDEDSNQSVKDFQPGINGGKLRKAAEGSERESFKSEDKKSDSNTTGSLTKNRGTNALGHINGISVGDNKALSDTISNNDGTTKGKLDFSASKKRPLTSASNNGNAAKKAKQSSLFSSFAKQKSLLEMESKKGRTCPICAKAFPANAWNSEINNHIDNCLIE